MDKKTSSHRSRFGFGRQAPEKLSSEGPAGVDSTPALAEALWQGRMDVVDLPLELVLESPHQPRQRAIAKKDVEDLMHSIAATGQTQPIIVTPGAGQEEGKYFVHAGHRRCTALRFLGKETVRALVRTDLDERTARRVALADNLGREDLTAHEEAESPRISRRLHMLRGWSHGKTEQVSVGGSRASRSLGARARA